MSRISATTDVLPPKAIARPHEAAQPQPPAEARPSPSADNVEKPARPSETLQSMLNTRRQGVNSSLKAMIADAGVELDRQEHMIQDVDRILTAEKARKAYAPSID
jgi:hypothetical protein